MVHVLLFATLAEAAGEHSLQLEIPSGTTVQQIWDLLLDRYPRLAGHARKMLRSVNGSFAAADRQVQDGDEVAFFPPVSGG
jgi:sulfur-carrier protein